MAVSKPDIIQQKTTDHAGLWLTTGQGGEQLALTAQIGVGVAVGFRGRRGDPPIAELNSAGIAVNVSGLPEAGLSLTWGEFAEMVNWWKQQTGR
jgi:hypothetical protein